MADPLDEPRLRKGSKLTQDNWPGTADSRDEVSGTRSPRFSDDPKQVARAGGKSRFQRVVNKTRFECQPDASRRLEVDGISQTGDPHLVEDPANTLAQFLTEPEIRADSSDSGVPRESSYVERVTGVRDPWKASRAFHLHPVVKNLHTNVVAGDAVGAVNDRVHKSFEPRVLGDESDALEASRQTKRASSGKPVENRSTSLCEL